MSNLKCPFCKKELELIGEKSDSGYPIDEYVCSCPETVFCFGNTVMWHKLCVLQNQLEESREDRKRAEKELIRTRKALEIIKKEMSKETMPDFAVISDALKIAEQKDVK